MRVVFIGSGNAYHHGDRLHQSIYVEEDGYALLVDAGATTLFGARRVGLKLESISSLLLTHFHGDHTGGIPYLFLDRERVRPWSELSIYGPAETEDIVRNWMELAYRGHEYKLHLKFEENTSQYRCGPFRIEPMNVTHSPESQGYRIFGHSGSVAISGDCELDQNLVNLCNGVDAAIVEATIYSGDAAGSGHVSLEELKRRRNEFNCKQMIATHLSQTGPEVSTVENNIVFAYDGMGIDI